jgi:hypothetical protein
MKKGLTLKSNREFVLPKREKLIFTDRVESAGLIMFRGGKKVLIKKQKVLYVRTWVPIGNFLGSFLCMSETFLIKSLREGEPPA